MTENNKNLIRDQERIRMQKYKQKLMEEKLPQQICQSQAIEPPVNSYKTQQSLRKAINRAARKLPYSVRKKAAVMKGLTKQAGFKIDEKLCQMLVVKLSPVRGGNNFSLIQICVYYAWHEK